MLGGNSALHQAKHFSRLRMPRYGLLREDPAPIHLHLERTAGRLDQFHVGVRVDLADLGRQTGGPGLVVSDDAVFDRNSHV